MILLHFRYRYNAHCEAALDAGTERDQGRDAHIILIPLELMVLILKSRYRGLYAGAWRPAFGRLPADRPLQSGHHHAFAPQRAIFRRPGANIAMLSFFFS